MKIIINYLTSLVMERANLLTQENGCENIDANYATSVDRATLREMGANIVEPGLQFSPILESFGNARTMRDGN